MRQTELFHFAILKILNILTVIFFTKIGIRLIWTFRAFFRLRTKKILKFCNIFWHFFKRMICDPNICSLEYVEHDVLGEIFPTGEEFVTNLQHEKCKVIQLVRKQIQKFNDIQYDLGTIKTDVYGHDETELKGMDQETILAKSSSINLTQPTAQQPPSREMFITNIVDRIRHRVNLILAALVIGVLVWMSLVYGALLGASLCSGSRSCFPFAPFKYSHAKHSLF